MKGVCLTFYASELKKHNGILFYEWMLELARKQQIQGGSVFKSIAGFGSHSFHEASFFELASNVPVEIRFLITKEESERLLSLMKDEKIEVFYSILEAEYGVLGKSC